MASKISALLFKFSSLSLDSNDEYITNSHDFDKFAAFELGVIEWANIKLLCKEGDNNDIKTERFRRFVKYYCINRLSDTNLTMTSKLVRFIMAGLFINQRKIGFASIDSRNEESHQPHMYLRMALLSD